MPDKIRANKISIFLEQRGPDFEFNSRSLNYYMPKKGSSGALVERNST